MRPNAQARGPAAPRQGPLPPPGIEATWLYPRLWIGSFPKPGRRLSDAGFKVLVLCAEELQPPANSYPGVRVLRAPMDDSNQLSSREVEIAMSAGDAVAEYVGGGQRTLVTCHLGVNRSAFVCVLALMLLTGESARVCIDHVRERRVSPIGMRALHNDHFRKVLLTLG